jgi:hypothetical protein
MGRGRDVQRQQFPIEAYTGLGDCRRTCSAIVTVALLAVPTQLIMSLSSQRKQTSFFSTFVVQPSHNLTNLTGAQEPLYASQPNRAF